jgi:hypothetical protein
MPHLKYFIPAEVASVAEMQGTKHNFLNGNPDETGSLTESVSASKEITEEVKNTGEIQTQVAANGKVSLFLWPVLYFFVGKKM